MATGDKHVSRLKGSFQPTKRLLHFPEREKMKRDIPVAIVLGSRQHPSRISLEEIRKMNSEQVKELQSLIAQWRIDGSNPYDDARRDYDEGYQNGKNFAATELEYFLEDNVKP